MGFETISYESIDLRDGISRDIYVSSKELVEIEQSEKDEKTGKSKKVKKQVPKYIGYAKGEGPVAFLATDKLSEKLDSAGDLPQMFRICWKGLQKIKGGKQFNVFTVQKWVGEMPTWTTGNEDMPKIEDDMPEIVSDEIPY